MQYVTVKCTARGAANAQAVFDTLAGFRLMGSEPLGVRWSEPENKRRAHVLTFKHFSPEKAQSMLLAIYPSMRRCLKCTEVLA